MVNQNIKLSFDKEELVNARLLLEEERIEEVTNNEIFKAGIYCILAQAERYDKQIKIYRRFLSKGLDSPESIWTKKGQIHHILKKAHYPNEKERRIKNLAQWWTGAAVPHLIVIDVGNGRKRGIELRNALAGRAPGIGYKSASLVMIKCGYETVIPIDIWILRFLREQGYGVKVPDYMTVGGMTESTYLYLEDVLRGMAKEAKIPLALFQAALWGKYSTWKVRKERRLF